MAHGNLAQSAALVGAVGSVLVLVARGRWTLLLGFAALLVAEAWFAVALVPRHDLQRLDTPLRLGASVFGLLVLVGLAAVFFRYPAIVPVALLLVAPFRLPVHLGGTQAFLLLPLYAVLASACLALIARAFREPVTPLPRGLAYVVASFAAIDAVSLLWAMDLQKGSVELAFFIFPFVAVLAVVARSPFASWLPRALAVVLVGLACVFAAIGLWQEATHRVFFAHDLSVANTYASFFRVTAVFHDPSIYGRHLVLAITTLLVLLWLGRVRFVVAAPIVGFVFFGLYYSYSQSSMAVLFAMAILVTLGLGDRVSRWLVGAVAVVALVGAGAFAVKALNEHSAKRATSGRTRLVSVTATVIRDHPLFGVGVGSQPLASRRDAKTRYGAAKDASHTTPLTVLAELGIVGGALYAAFLVVAWRLLARVIRERDRALGFSLAAAFVALVLHSLFYSGFFEDPIAWGILGLAAASLVGVTAANAPGTESPAEAHPAGGASDGHGAAGEEAAAAADAGTL
jgi:O-antigen ligase